MLAIFIVPVLFVTITRIAYGKEGLKKLEQEGREHPEGISHRE